MVLCNLQVLSLNQRTLEPMRLFFSLALIGLFTSFSAQETITYPYNPDGDGDHYIASPDLLDLLSIYGSEFAPTEIFVDGESLGEYLLSINTIIQTLNTGSQNGEFLRWNQDAQEWQPELILQNLLVDKIDVNDEAIFFSGVAFTDDVSFSGNNVSFNCQVDFVDPISFQQSVTFQGDATFQNGATIDGDLNASGLVNGRNMTSDGVKLDGIETGAEVNVQADWNATTGNAQILNKPVISTVATTGNYNDLSDTPSIPDISTLVSINGNQSVLGVKTFTNNTFVNKKLSVTNTTPETNHHNLETSYPMSIGGAQQGLWITLKSDNQSAAPGDNNHFIKFATKQTENTVSTPWGRIQGNDAYSEIADLIGYLMNLVNQNPPSEEFVATCQWDLYWGAVLYAPNDNDNYLKVKIQRASNSHFPPGYTVYTEGWGDDSPLNDDQSIEWLNNDGDCVSNECWKYIKIPVEAMLLDTDNSHYSLSVPDNRRVRLQYFGDYDEWGGWVNDDAYNANSISLSFPDGEISATGLITEVLGPNSPHGSHWKDDWRSCPEPQSAGTVDGESNYAPPPTTGIQSFMDLQSEVYEAVEEVQLILEFINNTIDVIVSFFPPGVPFDAWDILDAVMDVLFNSMDLAIHYAVLAADVGVEFESGGADYAEMASEI